MRRPPLPFLLALAVVGCTSPHDRTTRTPTVLEPTLQLDLLLGNDDTVLVERPTDATRLSDGRIVFVDGGRDQLVFLDASGRLERQVGRSGGGPGEFQSPAWIERCHGDSLFVWDQTHALLSVFDPEGGFVRQFRLPISAPFQLSCNGIGTLAAYDASAGPRVPPAPGEQPLIRGPLLLISSTGDSLAAVADLPLGRGQAFGALAGLAVTTDRVVLGIGSTPVLRWYSFAGEPGAIDSLPLTPRLVSDSLYDAELDRMAGLTGSPPEMQARIREMLAVAAKPSIAPYFQTLHASDDGTIWLVTSLPTDPATTLFGRRVDGRVVTLAFPDAIEVYQIGDDFLLGKTASEDGQERLVVWRWER